LIDVASRFQSRINRENAHNHYGIDRGTVTLEPFNCTRTHDNHTHPAHKFCVSNINALVGSHLHIRDYVRAPLHFDWHTLSFASAHVDQNIALNHGTPITIQHYSGPEPNPYKITLLDSHGPIDVVTIRVIDTGVTTPGCLVGVSTKPVIVIFSVQPGVKFHIGLIGAILHIGPDEIRECSAKDQANLKPNQVCVEFVSPQSAHGKRDVQQEEQNTPQENANNFLDALNNGLFDSAGAIPDSGTATDASLPSHAPGSHAPGYHAPGSHSPQAGSSHKGLGAGALAAIIFVAVFVCAAVIILVAVLLVVKKRNRADLDHF